MKIVEDQRRTASYCAGVQPGPGSRLSENPAYRYCTINWCSRFAASCSAAISVSLSVIGFTPK